MTTTTTTTYGTIQGTTDGGVVVFRGIPYAQPPVGPLRFAPPQPPDSWTGLRDATTFGPIAMQAPNAIRDGLTAAAAPSEDCLTLNVWTPAVDGARRPVMVWLHGGAFLTGAGSRPMSNGTTLARRGDVVVVTINYRLGLFGYLRGIDVCGDALPSTGNEGLLDQIAALTWVKQEIAAFGGDPENVTVFGQSAGAISISAMLAMGLAPRLFQKAILQSGSALLQPPATANQVMEKILADVGLAPQRGRPACATCPPPSSSRSRPGSPLVPLASPTARSRMARTCPPIRSRPSPPAAHGASRSSAAPTWRSGDSSAVWTAPWTDLTDDGLLARLADPRTSVHSGDAASSTRPRRWRSTGEARAARGESTAAPDLWLAMMGDRRYRVQVSRLAELHAAHTSDTYAYLFTWRSPAWNGSSALATSSRRHSCSAPSTRQTPRISCHPGRPVGDLSAQMQDAWTAFARTGRPQTPASARLGAVQRASPTDDAARPDVRLRRRAVRG